MAAARRASTGLLLALTAVAVAPSAARLDGRRLQVLLVEPSTLPPGCDLDCLLDKHPYLQVERTREAVEHVLRTEMNSKIYGLAQGPYACMCRGKVFDGGEPDPPLGERDPSKAAALLGACDLGCFFDNHLWLQRKIEHTEEAVLDLVRAKQLEIVPDACVCNGKATGRATENREIPDPGNREKEGNGNVKEPEAEAAGAAASEEAARLVEKRDNPDPVDQMKDDNSHRNEPATDAGNREIDSDEHLKEPEAEAAGAIGEAAPLVEERGNQDRDPLDQKKDNDAYRNEATTTKAAEEITDAARGEGEREEWNEKEVVLVLNRSQDEKDQAEIAAITKTSNLLKRLVTSKIDTALRNATGPASAFLFLEVVLIPLIVVYMYMVKRRQPRHDLAQRKAEEPQGLRMELLPESIPQPTRSSSGSTVHRRRAEKETPLPTVSSSGESIEIKTAHTHQS